MANQYFADVPKGFSVPKQVRVDYKTNIQNENTLKNLGVNNNLAFTYYEGLEVYCKEEKTKYVWREVNGIEIGLLPLHFTYPTYPAIDGIDYSGKQFNFFLINRNQIPADGSETKLNAGQNITITGQGTAALPYTISASFENEPIFIESGTNVTITGTGSEIDPYIINSNVNDLGLIKENNNRILAPNQSLSLINSDVTGKAIVTKEYVDNISIPVVDGSETKINPGNNVTITGSGTQLNPYVINSVSEQSSIFINSTDQIDVVGNGTLENPYTFFNLGLDLKANLESPTFTGTVTAPIIIGELTGNADTATKLETPITINNVSFDGSTSITITDDSREPRVNKQNNLLLDGTGNKFPTVDAVRTHTTDLNNPHEVTKAQVGLANVDNTSDLNKPVSNATQSALDLRLLGSGTASYLPLWNAQRTQVNSSLFQDANGNVGLNSTAPYSVANFRFFTANGATGGGFATQVAGVNAGRFGSFSESSFFAENRDLPIRFVVNGVDKLTVLGGSSGIRLHNAGGAGQKILTANADGNVSATFPDLLLTQGASADAVTTGVRHSMITPAANQAHVTKLNASGQLDNWIINASTVFIKYQTVERTGRINFLTSAPTAPNPLSAGELANKGYVDALVAAGGSGTPIYQPYQRIVRFEVPLNTVNPLIQTGTTVDAITHPQLIENDWGVLMLPTTYSPTGAPTRLVIGCHGGGGTVTATGSQTETYDLYKYLVSQGYAVMDMAGMPASMATRLKVDQFRVMGNPVAVTAYQKGYEWIIRNYNINREGVFINGGSNGGLTGLNIVENSNIPVIAMSGMSPLVDMEINAWNLTTPSISGGWATSFGNRLNIIKLYGMTDPTVFEADGTTVNVSASQANLNNSVFEADKVIGFAPMLTNVWDDAGVKKKKLKVPYKIWQPIDDNAVLHSSAVTFINMLKAGGSYAILRTMDSGGHAPETAGTPIGTFVYDGATLNLHASVAELLQWYSRFN